MEDSSPVQLSKEISYSISSMEHPSYQFNKINPLQQNSLSSLATAQEITWEIPAYVWNPAKSYISFIGEIKDATNAKILHLNQPWMNALTLSTRSGLRLLDLNSNLEMFYNMQSSFNTVEELETSDISRQLVSNNQTKDHFFSQRYTPTTGSNADGTITGASLNFVEQQYVEISSLAPVLATAPTVANAAYSKRIVIPLNKIRDTILAEDKDFLFNEILILRVQFGDVSILGSENLATTITNARGGINASSTVVAVVALPLTTVNLSEITFWCAQEMNQSIVNSIAQKENSVDGFEVLAPVSYIYKTSTAAATNTSITQRMTSYHGRYLKKVIYSAYLSPSAVIAPFVGNAPRLKYDRSNLTTANADTTGAKLIEFYDNLNNNRLSQVNYRCAQSEDYDHMRRYHAKTDANPRGTVISNKNIFYYNHHFVRDFTNDEEVKNVSKSSLALGLDLTNEVRYDWYNVSQANIALDHYMIVSCSKLLKVSSQGVSFN